MNMLNPGTLRRKNAIDRVDDQLELKTVLDALNAPVFVWQPSRTVWAQKIPQAES